MGGLDKIHAIHSLVLRGFHYEGSYPQEGVQHHSANGVLVRMRPHYRLVGCRPSGSVSLGSTAGPGANRTRLPFTSFGCPSPMLR